MAKSTVSPSQIRAWARENNLAVGTRGVLASSVKDAFRKAHTPSGKPKATASA